MIFSLFKKNRDDAKVPEARVIKAPSPASVPGAPGAPSSLPADSLPPASVPPTDGGPFTEGFTDFSLGGLAGSMELDEEADPLESLLEQAAVLYANGQDGIARGTLEDGVQRYRSGPLAERLWLMLFDLHQLRGDKSAFEALELEFARNFERSPPTWAGSDKSETATGSPNAILAFKGGLEGDNDAAFGILADALERPGPLGLDLSQVTRVDDPGAQRLLKLLQGAAKGGKSLELLGATALEDLLAAATAGAENPHCWLLQLELLQRLGSQEAFEEKAVDYAVAFEVSPPSWDSRRQAAPPARPPVPEAPPPGASAAGDDAAYFGGDLKNYRFAELKPLLDERKPLILDFSRVQRIDFVSAGTLVNLLTPCKRAGTPVLIRKVNRLVFELLAVVGVNAVARIEPARK